MQITEQQLKDQWSSLCRNFPLVCGVNTYNNELTIYACLQQAIKNFHQVIVFDDGSTDRTFYYIDKFIEDYNPQNLIVMSVDHIDPWPDQKIEKDHGPGKGVLMKKTHAKSKVKAHNIIKQNFPNAFYVSLESDVICNDSITSRIYDRISRWDDPLRDVEFFNVMMTIDREYFRAISASEEKWVPLPGIQQRGPCDHPGDWTLACFWNGGVTNIQPDPSFPYGACTFPWSMKNQTKKKGQDTDDPYGFHMYNYNNKCLDADTSKSLKFTYKELDDPFIDINALKNVWFPKELKLDKEGKRYVEVLQ
jgi:glycosyltransferase involved in cell wall biosynthesis